MCVIIDANAAADFCKQEDPYLITLLRWVNSGGRVVSGGKLEIELFKVHAMKGLLIEWSRSGKLRRISQDKISILESAIKSQCLSDDPHVVALAIASRASVIVTNDVKLIADLKNKILVGEKRRIYKKNSASTNKTHRHRALLQRSDCP